MTAGPLITVHDRTSFSVHVSPEQAAAYVRGKLPGWTESNLGPWLLFDDPATGNQVALPVSPVGDAARCIADAVGILVGLGCAQQPSQVLAAMAAIHCERTAPDGDGCWLGPKREGECRSHEEMVERGEVEP